MKQGRDRLLWIMCAWLHGVAPRSHPHPLPLLPWRLTAEDPVGVAKGPCF